MPKEPITRIDLPQAPKWARDIATEIRTITQAVDDMRAILARVDGRLDEVDVLRARVRDLEIQAQAEAR